MGCPRRNWNRKRKSRGKPNAEDRKRLNAYGPQLPENYRVGGLTKKTKQSKLGVRRSGRSIRRALEAATLKEIEVSKGSTINNWGGGEKEIENEIFFPATA